MNKNLNPIFHNKRIFLTGHTGFKGAWMAMILSKLGAKVYGYSLKAEEISLFNLVNVEKFCEKSTIGDIRSYDSLQKAYIEAKPDIVMHFAAQPLVLESYQNPLETMQTNVIGVANLFEIIRKNPLNTKTILNVTSDKCYENREWIWPYRENDALGGYDPYSASKGMAEILTNSYRRSFFNDLDIVLCSGRAGNVIGGGDFGQNRLIPDLIRSIENNKILEIRSPNAIRPWQHVLDVILGYLMITTHGIADGYNIAPLSSDVCVKDLLDKTISELSVGKYEIMENSNQHEANLLRLDSTKIRNEIGWKNRFDINETIKLTAEWYNIYLNNADQIVNITEKQIEKFVNL